MALRKLLSSEKEEDPRSGDQKRISAQELALAVASLEQRHAQAAQSQAETLSVDEAIRDLGLPFSSLELWAEVQARRDRRTAETKSPSRFRVWMQSRRKTVGFTFTAALLASAVAYGVQTRTVAEELSKYPVQYITLTDVSKYEIVREPTAHGIRICTLDEVPDDVSVFVNADALVFDNQHVDQTMQNDTPDRLTQFAADGEPSVWRIVKHEGKLYVRGWVAYDVSPSAARLLGITLYGIPTALGGGHKMLPLTLRATRGLLGNLNLMTSRATGDGGESIHFERVQLDSHAEEKW